jgi:L-asparaginase
MYTGADGSFVRHAADSGAQGLVVEGVGAGNVNADVYKAIQYALGKKIPVVISSRVYNGAVEPIYGDLGGGKTLEDAGCILANNLMGTKARLLLMLGITQYGNDITKLRKLFNN